MSFFEDITGGLFGKEAKAGTQQSGVQELINLFPEYKNIGNDLLGRGAALSNQTQPYVPADVAPLTTLEQQAIGGLGNYSAPKYNFDFGNQANTAYGMASDFLNQAPGYFAQGAAPITSGQISSSISDFTNPFEEQVVSGLTADAQKALDYALNRSAASSGNAFGGTRGAMYDATITDNNQENLLNTLANARSANFTNASNLGLNRLQQTQANQLAAGQGMTGAGQAMTGLGGQLWNSKMGVDDLMTQDLNRFLALTGAKMDAGGTQRGVYQDANNREAQVRQIPMQQLDTLVSLLNAFPNSGSQYGGTGEQQGMFNRILEAKS